MTNLLIISFFLSHPKPAPKTSEKNQTLALQLSSTLTISTLFVLFAFSLHNFLLLICSFILYKHTTHTSNTPPPPPQTNRCDAEEQPSSFPLYFSLCTQLLFYSLYTHPLLPPLNGKTETQLPFFFCTYPHSHTHTHTRHSHLGPKRIQVLITTL